jgi:hypothetical protein
MTGCTAEQAQDAMDVKLTATTLYCYQGHFSEASYEPLRVRLKAGAMPMTHTVPVLTAEEVRQLRRTVLPANALRTHGARNCPCTQPCSNLLPSEGVLPDPGASPVERAAWHAKVVAGPTGVGSHYRAALDGAKPIHPAHFTADQVHQLKVRGGNSGTVTRLYSKPGVQPRKEARSRNHETPGTTATDAAVRPGPERLRAAGTFGDHLALRSPARFPLAPSMAWPNCWWMRAPTPRQGPRTNS